MHLLLSPVVLLLLHYRQVSDIAKSHRSDGEYAKRFVAELLSLRMQARVGLVPAGAQGCPQVGGNVSLMVRGWVGNLVREVWSISECLRCLKSSVLACACC